MNAEIFRRIVLTLRECANEADKLVNRLQIERALWVLRKSSEIFDHKYQSSYHELGLDKTAKQEQIPRKSLRRHDARVNHRIEVRTLCQSNAHGIENRNPSS